MNLLDVLNHHLSGGQFEYKSFDFLAASEEYQATKEWKELLSYERGQEQVFLTLALTDKYQIPKEIREKHSFWRKGKIRSVHFNPKGEPVKVLIGAKYAVTFYDYSLNDLRLI